MSYLNVTEVDTAVVNLSTAYPALAELIPLPNPSIEGRPCHALRLGGGAAGTRDCVIALGGVHAREWGSCEILISFAADLLEAKNGNMGLVYGGKSFTAAQIQNLMNQLHIIIFPLANPDGRNYSQTVEAYWRKNRNAANSGGNASCIGVDINRNYDFLFNYKTAFAATSGVSVSDDPCDYQVYQGPAPFSEPETQNIKWLLDTNPRTRWFIDVHSYSEDILYNWGDDDNQSSNPAMTFQNAAFNGLRGIQQSDPGGPAYQEFIPSNDQTVAEALAMQFRDGLQAVRGKTYTAKQSFQLYPTAGASDDYVFSRHIVDPSKTKCFGFVVEWGTEFQPPWAEMELIIQDVSAGLIQFCVTAPSVTGVNTLKFFDDGGTFKFTDDGGTFKFADDTLKFSDDGGTLKFVDDGGTLKFADDTLKFSDDGGTFKFVDDGGTLKFADDGGTFKFGDDKGKFTDDGGGQFKFISDTKGAGQDAGLPSGGAGDPGPQPAGAGIPFILATPHHSYAWTGVPGPSQGAPLNYQSMIAQYEAALRGLEQGMQRESAQLQALDQQYRALLAAYKSAVETHQANSKPKAGEDEGKRQ